MIWLTLPQAAARVGVPVAEVEAWVGRGTLVALKHPVDGHRYVQEQHLLDVERAVRTGAHGFPPSDLERTDPAPAAEILSWLLTRHGIDLGSEGPALLRQWAVRYPGLRHKDVPNYDRRPGRPPIWYDRQAVLAVAQRLRTRRAEVTHQAFASGMENV